VNEVAANRMLLKQTAVRGCVLSYQAKLWENRSVQSVVDEYAADIVARLEMPLQDWFSIKWYVVVWVKLVRADAEGHEESIELPLRSTSQLTFRQSDHWGQVAAAKNKIQNTFEEIELAGSGWTLDAVTGVELNIVKNKPIIGCGIGHLPTELASMQNRSLISINSNNGDCFALSVLAALHGQSLPFHKRADAAEYAKFRPLYFFEGVSPHTALNGPAIRRFETNNKISVNIYGFEASTVFPICVTTKELDQHVDILYLGETSHYVAIISMPRLLRRQCADNSRPICRFCLQSLRCKRDLENHRRICGQNKPMRVKLPDEGSTVSFRGEHKRHPVIGRIYADLESFLKPVNVQRGKTTAAQEHVNCSAAGIYLGSDGRTERFLRRQKIGDPDLACVMDFICFVEKCCQFAHADSRKKIRPLTNAEQISFKTATSCYLCGKCFTSGDVKTKDHSHATGDYRGCAHQKCNILYHQTRRIPVVFHGMKHYDGSFLLRAIGRMKYADRVTVVPSNTEKYLSFTLKVPISTESGEVVMMSAVFIDSFQFMSRSLSNLADTLDDNDFAAVKSEVSNVAGHWDGLFVAALDDDEKLRLLRRKGVFPYSHLTDANTFDETRLPPPAAFYNDLTGEEVGAADYDHAESVWHGFTMTKFSQFHDIYLITDCLLLMLVFERFRLTCQAAYDLDPLNYLTTPSLSWDACLKMTGVELELIACPLQMSFFEDSIRGGLSQITTRYARANNENVAIYFGDEPIGFDEAKPRSFITYLDVNNLYGTAMCESLPYRNFEWIDLSTKDAKEEVLNGVMSAENDDEVGMTLEVTLIYPKHLHDVHNDLPLCPDRMTPPDYSAYQKELFNASKGTARQGKKLIAHLGSREHIKLHARTLRFYIEQGMVVREIHSGIRYDQKPWLKEYIELNTKLRQSATSPFASDFFKLMNNSAYGKTMENVRKRCKVVLVDSEKKLLRHVKKPSYKRHVIFDEDLVGVEKSIISLELNKPIYVGSVILDISKTLLYRFHYCHMLRKYGPDRLHMLMTDTDSLMYLVETDDLYADMLADQHLYDTSNYDKSNPLFSMANHKRLGLMKDETPDEYIYEFCGLRSKMYSVSGIQKPIKRAKGISRSTVQNMIRHDDYIKCLRERQPPVHQRKISNRRQHVETVTQVRSGLCSLDDKRYILQDNTTSLAHGHYMIPIHEALRDMINQVEALQVCVTISHRCM
jgi:hypothetical protein